jgi:3-methyladenine DNA glycosylase/8-oxoguanine DNA glycosylase
LAATIGTVAGPGGTTSSFVDGVHYRASANPDGNVELALRREAESVVAEAWGPGAAAELEMVPRLLGLDDDPSSFSPAPGPVRELVRNNRGLHLGSTGRVVEALVPAILGQRVTSQGAKRSYYSLVRALGEPAPGPAGLRVPPPPERLAALDYEEFHRHGIERSRALIVREVARRAKRIEEISTMERAAAYERLNAIRGIGPWTAGHVMGVAWGDRDAVPVGDFHLPNSVSWLLAGEPRADDARMLELLEPYRPHRRRVVVLIKRGHIAAPRYGPKSPVQDIRAY